MVEVENLDHEPSCAFQEEVGICVPGVVICCGQQDAKEVMLDSGFSLRLPSAVLGPIQTAL